MLRTQVIAEELAKLIKQHGSAALGDYVTIVSKEDGHCIFLQDPDTRQCFFIQIDEIVTMEVPGLTDQLEGNPTAEANRASWDKAKP